jgi:para-aminobenzoate synthetase component 1
MEFVEQLNQWGAQKKPFVFIIDFEQKKPLAWLAEDCPDSFQFKFNPSGYTSQHKTIEVVNKVQAQKLMKYPISLNDYTLKYNQVRTALHRGDSFLINLTIPTPVHNQVDFQTYFNQAQSKYVLWLKDAFISFSPETFVQIKAGKIATFPMKGTIDASLPGAKEMILNDPKEYAEHATIVDLLRNDLSRVATHVRVTNFRYYEEIKTQDGKIGQVSSAIEGQLPDDYAAQIGRILFDLLPAGSVSGAPKKKTSELIAEIEGQDRGYYTGIAGYFDGVNLDSCVLIRYLGANNVYQSGGGITYQSDLHSEYQEMINKVYVPIH